MRNCLCSKCGASINEEGSICPSCGTQQVVQTSNGVNFQNTSQAQDQNVSEITSKWNWGAFLFGWIWAVFNGVYWPLVSLIAMFIPFAGPVINLAIAIILGLKGSDMAYKSNTWKDRPIADFARVQKTWAKVGFIIIGISILMCMVFFSTFVALVSSLM